MILRSVYLSLALGFLYAVASSSNNDQRDLTTGPCPPNSVIDGSSKFCCPSSCKSCGGSGCHLRPGGPSKCCTSSISSSCSKTNVPPCKLDGNLPPPPSGGCPVGGISNGSGKCCAKSCKSCGGSGCHLRPGGASQCCTGSVTKPCDFNHPSFPCVLGPVNPPPPPPPSGGCPVGGISNGSGKCCAKSCQKCGGYGCDTRPGGASQCCTGSVTKPCDFNHPSFPCVLGPVNPPPPPPSGGCPVGGISNGSGKCCAKSCQKCGGYGCDTRPGGASQCCTGSVTKPCDFNHPSFPCVLGPVNPPPPPPPPPPSGGCPQGSIPDSSGRKCCAASCQVCGGYGCQNRPGGASACCTGGVTRPCAYGLPCNLDSGSKPKFCPYGTIPDYTGTKCCRKSCQVCGGFGCDSRPGGASQCCTGNVNVKCKTGVRPCVADEDYPPTTAPPATAPPATAPPETDPPETDPPETDPPETDPPETDPPETDPPETDPPETDPPETDPPETDPPETDPPETDPPETDPPETDPPETDPPETDPPETDPPETDPPETDPPETDPPETDPPETDPPPPDCGIYAAVNEDGECQCGDGSEADFNPSTKQCECKNNSNGKKLFFKDGTCANLPACGNGQTEGTGCECSNGEVPFVRPVGSGSQGVDDYECYCPLETKYQSGDDCLCMEGTYQGAYGDNKNQC